MSVASDIPTRERNPFATCWTRPGAMEFSPTQSATVERCVELLAASDWRGQITGPHGVGKSTLLRAIGNAARSQGLDVHWLRAGSRPAPLPGSRGSVLLVDSFECLNRYQQWRWRHRPFGLVVTTHQPAGLPTIARLQPTLDDAYRLLDQLTATIRTPVSNDDLAASFRERGGNLREVWFDLYDLHEQRTRF